MGSLFSVGAALIFLLAFLVVLGLSLHEEPPTDPYAFCGDKHWTECITPTAPAGR